VANWYGSARSNYFKVKDVEKYKNFLGKWRAEYIESIEEILWDTQSEGSWTLPECVTEEQQEYIIEMVNHFL
jgi:hypothetical protein